MAARFAHLRTHSHYSLLCSPSKIDGLVAAAVADQQTSLALTDNGNLFGSLEFYKACKAAGVNPILGMVTYCAGVSRLEPSGAANPTSQLTLLASSNQGFDNLKRLSSAGHLEGFHYRPRIDRELLGRHSKGLIALSGDLHGEIPRLLQAGLHRHPGAPALRTTTHVGHTHRGLVSLTLSLRGYAHAR